MTETPVQTADAFSWNPFIAIKDDTHAAGLARGGAWAAGLIGLSYVLATAPILLSGRMADAGAAALASAAVAVGLAAALGWWVHARTSAIAAGLLLAWVTIEAAGGLWLAVRGVDATRAIGTLVDLFSLILAIQAWRGTWALRRTPATA